jgi:hypothetical protein
MLNESLPQSGQSNMADTEFGKVAEQRIRTWLDRPEDGYSFDRIPDQLSGYYMVSRNICDFHCYKYPYNYYIESKATIHDRLDFSQLTDVQRIGLRKKANIKGCYGIVVVLFVEYKRAFLINIKDITDNTPEAKLVVKSININKIDKWEIPYWEIETIPSRKQLLEYTGDLPDFSEGKTDA